MGFTRSRARSARDGPLSRCGGKLGNTQPNRLDSPADSVMSLAPVSALELSVKKNDLVERLAEEQGLTKAFARELVDSVFDMITVAASKGEEVSLFGFGRFKVAERAARTGPQSAHR